MTVNVAITLTGESADEIKHACASIAGNVVKIEPAEAPCTPPIELVPTAEGRDITVEDVKALRDATGRPLVVCHAALSEAQGDVDLATEELRLSAQDCAVKTGKGDTRPLSLFALALLSCEEADLLTLPSIGKGGLVKLKAWATERLGTAEEPKPEAEKSVEDSGEEPPEKAEETKTEKEGAPEPSTDISADDVKKELLAAVARKAEETGDQQAAMSEVFADTLGKHGDGAQKISDLAPENYAAVVEAAKGVCA